MAENTLPTWRIYIVNRSSSAVIRTQFVQAETLAEAMDLVSPNLSSFERCSGGLIVGR